MPDAPKHPVTVEDLWVQYVPNPPLDDMPDLRPATVADLVSALRAEGVLVIIERQTAREILKDVLWTTHGYTFDSILDALAEAQPFPPAGE